MPPTQRLMAAFDLPTGITIEAIGWGSWQQCHLRGIVIAFDCNNESVPRQREVRVMCDTSQESQLLAVGIAHKLRRMGWKNCKPEARV